MNLWIKSVPCGKGFKGAKALACDPYTRAFICNLSSPGFTPGSGLELI